MTEQVRLANARVHFIGIGGIGMCGLAELLRNMGVQVKGSDQSENQQTLRLRELGIKVMIGHSDANLTDVDVAVYSSAVKHDNVEYKGAKHRGIPLIPRAEALAEIMRLRRGIAVGGTHGKTTTTSMAATLFLEARVDPTIVIGGRLDLIKSTAKLGSGDWLIAEADESDGSFQRLSPELVIITNIDNDHLDHFGTIKNLESAFFEFAMRIPFYGAAIVCGDDKNIRRVFENFPKRLITYGFSEDNDYFLKGERSHYTVFSNNESLGDFHLQIPGRHNALNALAALIAGHRAGISIDKCLKGIAAYSGVDRRFQLKASVNGIDYYDDYGHHPTEVVAVLSAFKEQYPDRRLVVLFQPHRYSRTQQCWKEFTDAFRQADVVAMVDVYPAGETALPGVTAKKLLEEVKHKERIYFENRESACSGIQKVLQSGDIFLTLGAGDIYRYGEQIYLKAKS